MPYKTGMGTKYQERLASNNVKELNICLKIYFFVRFV
jgi:hypothetical protein